MKTHRYTKANEEQQTKGLDGANVPHHRLTSVGLSEQRNGPEQDTPENRNNKTTVRNTPRKRATTIKVPSRLLTKSQIPAELPTTTKQVGERAFGLNCKRRNSTTNLREHFSSTWRAWHINKPFTLLHARVGERRHFES
jgi:hypothetical protein